MPSLNEGNELLRRDAIRVGGLTAFGCGLAELFRAQRSYASEANGKSTAKSCILIWLDGGPSHLETFDPKPDAPAEVRGPLATVRTTVPGIHFGECLPRTASLMKHIAVIRSMTSPLGEHNFGTHYLMTGYKPSPVLEYPSIGSVLSHSRANQSGGVLPPNIAVPDFRVGGAGFSGNGFLPSETSPFSVGGDPSQSDFAVRDLQPFHGIDFARLDRRRSFAEAFNRFDRLESSGTLATSNMESKSSDLERAFDLINSDEAKRAFRLSDESSTTRDRYGRKTVGQSCLLARRLVERGVPFVTVNHRGWDTHNNLYTRLKEGYAGAKVGVGLIPSLDLALSSLLSDLLDRSMLDETLVVVMGEFGRTPKLNTQGGRDHWPRVFSVLLAGGGIAGGQIIGQSDAVGELPLDRPVTPSDLAATIYERLGVNPMHELRTDDGRPVRISTSESNLITELLG
ncbi:MAG: DUF1501 domain-containing protein [Planctomycetota bacterium]